MKKIIVSLLVGLSLFFGNSVFAYQCQTSAVYLNLYTDGLNYFSDDKCTVEESLNNQQIFIFSKLELSDKIDYLREQINNLLIKYQYAMTSASNEDEEVATGRVADVVNDNSCDEAKKIYSDIVERAHCSIGNTYWDKSYTSNTVDGMIACLHNKNNDWCKKTYGEGTTCYHYNDKDLENLKNEYNIKQTECNEYKSYISEN